MQRLQKLIAQAGITSRRKAEELILAGRVAVNGKVVTVLGSKADPSTDRIRVDGRPLRDAPPPQYLLFYKPKGVVTTMSDPEGRATIAEFLRGIGDRLYPVGRLDFFSEGLLVITNDGQLANRVLKASSALPKTYWVKVSGKPTEEQLEKLRRGVYVEGRKTAPAEIRWLSASRAGGADRRRAGVYRVSHDNPWLEVVLIEGRHHQIRQMFAGIGHPVEKLKRVAIGRLTIGQLQPGQLRPLTPIEVRQLKTATSASRRGVGSPRVKTGAAGSAARSGAKSHARPRQGVRP